MTGVPVEIPQHIIEAAVERGARALDAYGLTSHDAYDAASDVLAAVWPEIQTHVREQVAGEIIELPIVNRWGNREYVENFRAQAAAVARGAARPERYDRERHRVPVPPPEPGMGASIAGLVDEGAGRDGDTNG